MLTFFKSETERDLEWTADADYLEALRVCMTVKVKVDAADADRRSAWALYNFQGTNPPPDSPFWSVKQVFDVATQRLADATAALRDTEVTARARAKVAWIKKYRAEWQAVEAASDMLIEALDRLKASHIRAKELGIELAWVNDGQHSPEYLRYWKDKSRADIEQLT